MLYPTEDLHAIFGLLMNCDHIVKPIRSSVVKQSGMFQVFLRECFCIPVLLHIYKYVLMCVFLFLTALTVLRDVLFAWRNNFNSKKVRMLCKSDIKIRMQWFPNPINPYFTHNREESTYQMFNLRKLFNFKKIPTFFKIGVIFWVVVRRTIPILMLFISNKKKWKPVLTSPLVFLKQLVWLHLPPYPAGK